jgi:hypothetical protein
LITAIDTDLEWVRQHTRFALRAAYWEARGRDNAFLLHGMELREAIRWLRQAAAIKSGQPAEAHEQYIRASEESEAGEIQRLREVTEGKVRRRPEAAQLSRGSQYSPVEVKEKLKSWLKAEIRHLEELDIGGGSRSLSGNLSSESRPVAREPKTGVIS